MAIKRRKKSLLASPLLSRMQHRILFLMRFWSDTKLRVARTPCWNVQVDHKILLWL
jgi:hypothetical protein